LYLSFHVAVSRGDGAVTWYPAPVSHARWSSQRLLEDRKGHGAYIIPIML
jgi:hypothetical protein